MNFAKFFFFSIQETIKKSKFYPTRVFFLFFKFIIPRIVRISDLFNTKVQSRILLASVSIYGPFEIYTFFTRVTRCVQQRTRPKNTPQDVGEDGSFVRNSPRRSIDNETLPPHSPWNTY